MNAKKLPTFIDIRAILAGLDQSPSAQKLANLIKKTAMTQSCSADLSQSADCCSALEKLLASPRKSGTLERATTEASLLSNAVFLYARATSTNGKNGERGSIQITSKLTPDQLVEHNAIIAVRNRALAHVYADADINGQIWESSSLFLVDTEEGWLPGTASQRVQFHKETLQQLTNMIPVAGVIVRARFQERQKAMCDQLLVHVVAEKPDASVVVDPIKLFGSHAGVEMALNGIKQGWASGIL